MTAIEVLVTKDEKNECPIPDVWRAVFSQIVDSFVKKDYALSSGVEGVTPVSNKTASQIKNYIEEYGEDLIHFPFETWNSSVCLWMGSHWDILIDLWTASEGRSDLVLGAQVSESENGYIIDIGMVYVP